jgi:glycosyltransferase involved in cell wall biosynthesis
MTTARLLTSEDRRRAAASSHPVVEIVVPVYNEARVLASQMRRLHRALTALLPFDWTITIVDNGSEDGTLDVANAVADELSNVSWLRLERPGRGRALRAAWMRSRAEVVAYTDVDLSTDLHALYPLVASVLSGHAAIAIGSRLLASSRTTRGPKRALISRAYNRLLHVMLGTGVRDAQCGFKAVRADVARALVPEVADQGWFFDTELLVRAERRGLRVVELPVTWVDDADSRVRILRTAWDDLRGVARLVRELGPRRPSRPLPDGAATPVQHWQAA